MSLQNKVRVLNNFFNMTLILMLASCEPSATIHFYKSLIVNCSVYIFWNFRNELQLYF